MKCCTTVTPLPRPIFWLACWQSKKYVYGTRHLSFDYKRFLTSQPPFNSTVTAKRAKCRLACWESNELLGKFIFISLVFFFVFKKDLSPPHWEIKQSGVRYTSPLSGGDLWLLTNEFPCFCYRTLFFFFFLSLSLTFTLPDVWLSLSSHLAGLLWTIKWERKEGKRSRGSENHE